VDYLINKGGTADYHSLSFNKDGLFLIVLKTVQK